MGQLDGRVALVTGGGRGIGRGISELLAAEGATVAVNYRRDAEAAADTVDAIRSAGGEAAAFQASVDDADACAAMVDAVVAEFGGLDILVCNAGIASRGNSVADTDPAEMMRVVAAHAFGPHHLARLAVPHLRASRPWRHRDDLVGGHVATTRPTARRTTWARRRWRRWRSRWPRRSAPTASMSTSSRPAWSRPTWACAWPARSRATATSRTCARSTPSAPFGRVCQPLDVANVVLWLCSDGAGYITGQRIECNGGG